MKGLGKGKWSLLVVGVFVFMLIQHYTGIWGYSEEGWSMKPVWIYLPQIAALLAFFIWKTRD